MIHDDDDGLWGKAAQVAFWCAIAYLAARISMGFLL